MYDVHLGLIGISAISIQHGQFDPKFPVEGAHLPPIIFAWIVKPLNARGKTAVLRF